MLTRGGDPINLPTGWAAWLIKQLNLVTKDELMGIEADIKTAFETYKANVESKIASQAESIATLNAKIAALPPGVDTAALQADLDEINAANAALTAVPAANTEPAPSPTTTDA